jgi:2-methylcitrate dehydratase PrpD
MTTSDDYDLSRVTRDLGKTWEAFATAPKPYSVCRHEHSSLFAILGLVHEHDLKPSDIQAIEVKTNSSAFKSVGKIVEPKTIAEAQFSLPFAAGLAVCDREVFQHQFRVERLPDPEILAIARKVRVSVDLEIDAAYPVRWSAGVTLTTSKGTFTEFVEEAPGEIGNPLSMEFISEKFRKLARASLSSARMEQVEAAVMGMEGLPKAANLGRLLRSDIAPLNTAMAS